MLCCPDGIPGPIGLCPGPKPGIPPIGILTLAIDICGFIWLGMFPGKLAGPEFLTLCLPIIAAPWSPAGPGRPGDPLWFSMGMFGGMLPMFCNLEFIPGIGWLSPAEFGPDRTPGLCLFIDIEEVERVCPWDIEGFVLGMVGPEMLGCPCQPWLGFPGMELLLAPTMLG